MSEIEGRQKEFSKKYPEFCSKSLIRSNNCKMACIPRSRKSNPRSFGPKNKIMPIWHKNLDRKPRI